MVKTGMEIRGKVKLEIDRNDGTSLVIEFKNLVMKWGLIEVAKVIGGSGSSNGLGISHLALGTGNTPPTESDTSLVSETNRDPVSGTVLPAPNANKVEFKVTHAQGAITGTFEEAALFDAATAGNMFNRVVFAPFSITAADTLTVTWTIEVVNV